MNNQDSSYYEREIERNKRVNEILASSFTTVIQELLLDDDVIEIMLNPDGRLWVDRLSDGRSDTGHTLSVHDTERIIRIIASRMNTVCNANNPMVSAELPEYRARFQGILPPLVSKPIFTVRKKALRTFSIDDYVNQGVMTKKAAQIVKKAVKDKMNILIAGGAGSGKTTLANAILSEIAKYNERIVMIEDTLELECKADDCVSLRVKEGIADLTGLLKATMRLRPDRIIVGEVRGGEALALLKAWNTGHPGGLSTVHANGPRQGLVRLEQLIQEAVQGVPKSLIAEAVDVIIYIERNGIKRQIPSIAMVEGCSKNDEYILNIIDQ